MNVAGSLTAKGQTGDVNASFIDLVPRLTSAELSPRFPLSSLSSRRIQ